MKRLLSFTLLSPLLILAQAEVYFSPVFDVSEVSEGITSISRSDLQAHLTFLASDAAEGRGTGQHGLQVAAEYIASYFLRLGLTPLDRDRSFFQRYELLKTKLTENNTLSLLYEESESQVRENFQFREDYFISPWGLTGSMELQAPVVFAGYGIDSPEYKYNDYAQIDVQHKIVLIIDGEPEFSDQDRFKGEKDTHFADVREKVALAKKQGASALLVVSNPKSSALFSKKFKRWERWLKQESMSLPTSDRPLPLLMISTRTADRILFGTGKTLEELQIELESEGKTNSQILASRYVRIAVDIEKKAITAQNVVGYFPGSDPEVGHETVVISAHYDHMGKNEEGTIWPGADDNGTGTSILLEIAEAVALNPNLPKRGFLFLAVSGEEKGLLGSKYYTSRPLLPLANTITDLNIDMVGRNAPDSIYIIGSNMISEDLHEINKYASTKVQDLSLNYRYNTLDDPNRFYYRSDHYNFAQRGIPIIFYFAGTHEDYHKPTDTVDKINFNKMEKVAQLVFLTGWGVAQNEMRPRKNAGQYPQLPDKIKL